MNKTAVSPIADETKLSLYWVRGFGNGALARMAMAQSNLYRLMADPKTEEAVENPIYVTEQLAHAGDMAQQMLVKLTLLHADILHCAKRAKGKETFRVANQLSQNEELMRKTKHFQEELAEFNKYVENLSYAQLATIVRTKDNAILKQFGVLLEAAMNLASRSVRLKVPFVPAIASSQHPVKEVVT